MSIKFPRATGGYISTADNANLTIQAGKCLIWGVVFDGVTTGDNPQYILSTGNYGSAGSLNLVLQTAAAAGSNANKLMAYVGTDTAGIAGSVAHQSGAAVFALYHTGTSLILRSCPVLNAAPATSAAVVQEFAYGLSLPLDGPASLHLGSRVDKATNRFCDQSLFRMMFVDGPITDLELAKLAYGMEITELGKTPAWYLRMDTVSDVQDRGSLGLTFTSTGALTTGTDPGFGYVPGNDPQTSLDSIDVSPPADWWIFQQSGGYDTVRFTGSISGTAPTAIEYQLRDTSGNVVKAWTALSGAQVSGGQWLADVQVAFGGYYQIEVRSKNGSTVLASSGVKAARFAVGNRYLFAGSSSAQKSFESYSGTGFTPAPNTAKFDGAWKPFDGNGCATEMAARLATITGGPVGFLDYGVGGDVLSDWIKSTYSSWTATVAGLNAVGNKLAGVFLYIGSNDAAAGTVASRAQHAANLRTLIANIRNVAGQANLPVLLSGFNRRTQYNAGTAASFDVQANRVRMAESDVGNDDYVTHVQTLDFELSSDGIHLTDKSTGFLASGVRSVAVWARRLYGDGVYMRGPKVAKWSINSSVIVGTLQHRGSTAFTPASGITGLTVSDAAGAVTIASAVSIGADQVQLSCTRPLVAPVTVQYLAGSAPAVGTPIYGNTSPALPMVVETDLAATFGSGPPVVDVDASKIPASRKVIFRGGIRTVRFK